ncbi:hypothetical protein ACHAWC_008513 [Mediolabrus comicus]
MAYSSPFRNRYDTCVICFDHLDLNGYDTAIVTGCAHTFHLNCIQRWVYPHGNCPSCRGRVSLIIRRGSGETLPVPPLRLPIYVFDNFHSMLFTIGRHCKLGCVIGLYEEFLETTDYWPRQHGNPSFHYGDERDVVISFKGHEVHEDATPDELGIKWQDEITIHHKVEVLLRMPDNKWEFVRTWWDSPIRSALEIAMARSGRLNIDDYWFVHNNNIISGLALRDTLQDFKIFSGDVIRVIRKSDVNAAMITFREEEAVALGSGIILDPDEPAPDLQQFETSIMSDYELLFNCICAVSKDYKKRMLEGDKQRVRAKMNEEHQHWDDIDQKFLDDAYLTWERYV